jgi:hypothetical protein
MADVTKVYSEAMGVVRFDYVSLKEKSVYKDTDPAKAKYEVTVLIPKTDTQLVTKVKGHIDHFININKLNPKFYTPQSVLKDGDEPDINGKTKGEAYAGHYYMKAKTVFEPRVFMPDNTEDPTRSCIESGDYGYVAISYFSYSFGNNCGISAGLGAVRFSHKGEPLGGSAIVNPFADIPVAQPTFQV